MRITIVGKVENLVVEFPQRIVELGDTWFALVKQATDGQVAQGDVLIVDDKHYLGVIPGRSGNLIRRLRDTNWQEMHGAPAECVKMLFGFRVYVDSLGYVYVSFIDPNGDSQLEFFQSVEEYNKRLQL